MIYLPRLSKIKQDDRVQQIHADTLVRIANIGICPIQDTKECKVKFVQLLATHLLCEYSLIKKKIKARVLIN